MCGAEIKDDFANPRPCRLQERINVKTCRQEKASFCNVQDLQGGIQCCVARDSVGEEDTRHSEAGYQAGPHVRDQKISYLGAGAGDFHPCRSMHTLSKSLRILPEVPRASGPPIREISSALCESVLPSEVKDIFVKRSRIISMIRRYLDGQGFMEVETRCS